MVKTDFHENVDFAVFFAGTIPYRVPPSRYAGLGSLGFVIVFCLKKLPHQIYSERGTQGCNAIHRGSENVIDPFKTITGKGIKRKMIDNFIEFDIFYDF